MTEQIKSAVEQLECARNTRIFFPKDISFDLAIRSLKAWEEVLQELEEKKDVEKLVPIGSTAMVKDYAYDESTICMAIDIIKQKLEQIEE